jgi:hypothetical protein
VLTLFACWLTQPESWNIGTKVIQYPTIPILSSTPLFHYSSIPPFLFLYMACQAVIGHFFVGMAVHTPAHGHPDKGLCRRFSLWPIFP